MGEELGQRAVGAGVWEGDQGHGEDVRACQGRGLG